METGNADQPTNQRTNQSRSNEQLWGPVPTPARDPQCSIPIKRPSRLDSSRPPHGFATKPRPTVGKGFGNTALRPFPQIFRTLEALPLLQAPGSTTDRAWLQDDGSTSRPHHSTRALGPTVGPRVSTAPKQPHFHSFPYTSPIFCSCSQ